MEGSREWRGVSFYLGARLLRIAGYNVDGGVSVRIPGMNVKALLIATLLAVLTLPAVAQEFHGLKLGQPLAGQLSKCASIATDIGGQRRFNRLCVEESNYEKHQMETLGYVSVNTYKWGRVITYNNETIVSPKDSFKDAGLQVIDGNIEGVTLEYDAADAEDKLEALKAKYGAPTSCDKEAMRTGIGLPVTRVFCYWQQEWGTVHWESFGVTRINQMHVRVQTEKLLAAAAKARERRKNKDF
jgi:hypothetical protein